jgi:small subunit ribosomal protein S6
MLERYKSMVEGDGGKVHRIEDWGRRQLAYPVAKLHKAHYLLMNIECSGAVLAELESSFKFNDAVVRKLVVRKESAESGQSPLFKAPEEEKKAEPKPRGAESEAPAAAVSEESV